RGLRLPDRDELPGVEKGLQAGRNSHRVRGPHVRRIQDVEEDHSRGRLEGLEAETAGHVRETVIRDLLWGCVVCRATESLRLTDRIEQCEKCGAQYRRTNGAQIAVSVAGQG